MSQGLLPWTLFYDFEPQKRSGVTKLGAQTQHRVVQRFLPLYMSKQSEITCARDKGVVFLNIGQVFPGSTGYAYGKPLFATPCCNTSRATWLTPSEPPHRKSFFEVLSFSAVFDTGCCCQLVCFEIGVLHFRLPLYTIPETGRLENTYSCGFWL